MPKKIKVAAICMNSTSDKTRNVQTALSMIEEAAKAGADWIQIPEMFAFHGPYDRVYEMAETEHGPIIAQMKSLAKKFHVVIIAGSMGEKPDENKVADPAHLNRNGHRRVYNTTFIIDRSGDVIARYRKTHLFNLINEDGSPLYCESDGYLAGSSLVRTVIDGYQVGVSICYDLRFPSLYAKLTESAPVDVLLAPSAFTKGTGTAHWELLLRARAIESQCYVFAANQVGEHTPGKESFGHSMVVSPWGEVLADTGAKVGIAYAEINPEVIASTRAKLPVLKNKRLELY